MYRVIPDEQDLIEATLKALVGRRVFDCHILFLKKVLWVIMAQHNLQATLAQAVCSTLCARLRRQFAATAVV